MFTNVMVERLVLASISTQEMTRYKEEVKNKSAQENDQRLDNTTEHKQTIPDNRHSDSRPHSDTGGHKDTDSHSDSGSHTDRPSHSQSSHSDGKGSHTDDDNAHVNRPGKHTDSVDATCRKYWDDGSCMDPGGTKHNNRDSGESYHTHTNRSSHSNRPGHSQSRHSQSDNHTDRPKHSDRDTHSDGRNHSDNHTNTTTHSNTGFDHQNYIPSRPHFKVLDDTGKLSNVDDDLMIRGVTTLAFYSYDKNIDGYGSTDTVSKNVKYTLRMRRIKDDDGNPSVGSWVTLLNEASVYTYDLDTTKYSEGYYEIECFAKNDSKSDKGVTKTYVGYTKNVKVRIKQNQDPKITVNNGGDFINFYFGYRGGYSPSETFKEYANDKQGLIINIDMIDPDDKVNQWQKGSVYLEYNGSKLPGTEADIIWENQSKIISSNNSIKKGSVFIPKEKYLVNNMTDVKVVITVKDYLDSGCTKSAGATIVQSVVSQTDSTQLMFNVDRTNPVGTITGNPSDWVNHDIVLNINAQDVDGFGVKRIKKPTGEWMPGSNVSSNIIGKNGEYIFTVEDKSGNQTEIKTKVDRIDKEKPTVKIDDVKIDDNGKINEHNKKENIKKDVKIEVSDLGSVENPTGISGIKSVRYAVSKTQDRPSTGWNNLGLEGGIITVDNIGDNYVHVEAIDNAGNKTYSCKGNYRINDPVLLSNLRIIEGDPGIIKIDGNEKIKVQGKDAYILKKNNFKNNYVVTIKNADKDKAKLYYSVKNVDSGEEVYKGESEINQDSTEYKFSVNYFTDDLLDNWKDGVYEVNVRCVDYEGTDPDNDFMSESTQKVYILIKKNAPPKPIIKVKEVSGGKEVNIEYPPEPSDTFNDPSISAYYKKEYQRTSVEGVKPYTGSLKVTKNETIAAIYTDIAGNVNKEVVNVIISGKGIDGGVDLPFEGVSAKVEEGRVANKYYINTRKGTDGEVNKNKLKFVKKLK